MQLRMYYFSMFAFPFQPQHKHFNVEISLNTDNASDVKEARLSNAVFMTHKWFVRSEELLEKFVSLYPFDVFQWKKCCILSKGQYIVT